MRFLRLLLAYLVFGCVCVPALADVPQAAKASVVKVRAYHADGRVAFGSAVVIGAGKLVTNAHVTHGARRIEVVENDRISSATVAAHDSVRDFCFLEAPLVTASAVPWSRSVQSGQKVYALGFPADRGFTASTGQIVALHEFEGAEVLQVSAPFDYGASGGGLFDGEGRLVGILTFKARAGGAFHFAVPVAWLNSGAGSMTELGGPAFWQVSGNRLPYFLRAASLEATSDWAALMALAREWTSREPGNRGAWNALAKARQHSVAAPAAAPVMRLSSAN